MTTHKKPIRSYVRREGRMTPKQKKALENLWPQYGLDYQNSVFDFKQIFAREAPTIIEIGFGMGHSLAHLALRHPENNYIGIEVHRPGVGALLAEIEENKIANIRIICHDAIEVLENCVADESIDSLLLFFPDPWPKKRHHKRRIVQPIFAELILTKLKSNGQFHMATDWQEYAEQMLEVMSANPGFINLAGTQQFLPRPESRPMTKFEKRGERLGHNVWDLVFIKVSQ